jgi:two-component system, OmpR family, response regulator MprA
VSKILVVEDESDLADQIRDWLVREQHLVEVVYNGSAALDRLVSSKYDAIILDWMLPGIEGLEVCKRFRAAEGKTPILMLTARSRLDDKEMGLDAGADDYLSKPFHLRELSARLRAILRRTSATPTSLCKIGDLEIDLSARRVMKGEKEIHLEPKEFNLLEFLARNARRTFSAEALLSRVWESDSAASPDAIRTYIKSLRRKLDTPGLPSIITTVHGVGYRLEAP